jgi:hypothetical protein
MRFLLAVAFCLLMLGQAEASNGCPPGAVVLFNGQCGPPLCPPGYTGKQPYCKPLQCPPGQTLQGNICVRATTTCPWGTHGRPPSCTPNKCPPNTTGTPPKCKGRAM